MATGCSSLHALIPRRAGKTATRVIMQHNNIKQDSRASTLRQSCVVNKVFHDQEIGVACYIDAKGEVVCEGYDEGPRISEQMAQEMRTKQELIHRRLMEMSDVEQLGRLRIGEDAGLQIVNGIAPQWLN